MGILKSITDAFRAKPAAPVPRTGKRNWSSAQISRLTNSWTTTPTSVNQDLYRDRRILVARSRELSKNNEYARQFLQTLKANVVGAAGMSVSVQALRPDGRIDEFDSTACELAFADFSRLGNFEVTKKLSRTDFERLWIETMAIDGETLVRRVRRGPHGYMLQMLDPLLIDDSFNIDLAGGNKIRMGVEIDTWGEVLAYHLLPERTNDIHAAGAVWTGQQRVRIPADEIWHDFIVERVGQLRGIPWMATAALGMNMLNGYEEAALVAARVGASKMGFFKKTEDAPSAPGGEDSLADDKDAAGNLVKEAEPGTFEILPVGYEFENFDPDYPHAMFGSFVKQCLRRVSASLPGVTYTSLSGDMESANYSSMRVDLLRERETWKAIQTFMGQRLAQRVYSEWLPYALAGGKIVDATGKPLPFSKLAKYDAAVVQGARWPWVDPQKEIGAQIDAIENGLTTRGRVIREQGGDPEEIWKELEQENKRLKNIIAPKTKTPAAAGVSTSGASNVEPD